MDEREKIISIIRPIIKEQYLMRCKEPDGCDNCWISCSVNERAKALADALIARGYGNVAEWKHRAEVAERALRNITERASCNICDNFSCRYYEGINFDYNADDCIKWWLAQAEKELAEEVEE